VAPETNTPAATGKFWRYADAERQRADRAAAVAADHTARAAGATEPLRELHVRMADLHRQAETRHRATARLAESHAGRLDRWLCLAGSEGTTSAPTFMDAILGAVGAPSAAAVLGGLRRDSIVVAASDATARAAYNLEVVLADGPATQVAAEGTPAAAAGEDLIQRWPRYGPAAAELGIHAVSAAPLAVLSIRLGVLCAYDREPAVRQSIVAATCEVARALTDLLVTAHRSDLGGIANGPGLSAMFHNDAAVHQAAGMISVQCDCSIADAMALLAAQAFADEMPVAEVADRVIAATRSSGNENPG
jgi:hypothetical protein